jgi:hypothetical protein
MLRVCIPNNSNLAKMGRNLVTAQSLFLIVKARTGEALPLPISQAVPKIWAAASMDSRDSAQIGSKALPTQNNGNMIRIIRAGHKVLTIQSI